MTQEYTDGPWSYAPAMQTGLTRPYEKFDIFHTTPDCYDNGYGVNTGRKKIFIGVVRSQASKTQTEANARLIASSTEMLTALRSALRMLTRDFIDDDKMVVIKQVAEAITKATGQEPNY